MKPNFKWIAALVLLLPTTAMAWGGQGHRMVGKLAAEQLTPRAAAQVAQLLAGEKDPTLGGVATWADNLRDTDRAYYNRTSSWHFVNMGEEGCVYQPRKHCPNGNCVIGALTTQARLLADPKQSAAVRRDALKFVVHLVGDLHQPLHAGYQKDRGGNTVQLNYNGKGTNLHRVWDSEMFYQRHLRDEAYMDLIRPLMASVSPLNPRTKNSASWAEQSCRVDLHSDMYPKSGKLEESYITRWRPIAEKRIAEASVQLADLLNRVL